MYWSASIAQLVVTGAMVIMRVVIRRNISAEPKTEELPEGYELDIMSKRINECVDWRVLNTPISDSVVGQKRGSEIAALASRVLHTRIRLAELSGWTSQYSETVDQLVQTTTAIMDYIFRAKGNVIIKKHFQQAVDFVLVLPISVLRTLTEEHGELKILLRRTNIEGKWTPWQMKKEEMAAIFSLWMSHFSRIPASAVSPNLWILGPNNTSNRIIYDWWICRGTERVVVPNTQDRWVDFGVSESRIFDLTSAKVDEKSSEAISGESLGVIASAPLHRVCGQHFLGTFLKSIINAIDRLEGPTHVTPGTSFNPFILVNDGVRGLAEVVQQFGLVSSEDSYRLIIPCLNESGILQDPFDVLEDIVTTCKTSMDPADQQQPLLEDTHWRLIYLCNKKAQSLSLEDRWGDAGRTYMRLIGVFSDALGAQDSLTAQARLAMKKFAAEFVDSRYNARSEHKLRPGKLDEPFRLHSAAARGCLDLVYEALEDGVGVDTWNDEHETPINLAITHGHLDVARLAMFYGAPIDRETLYGAMDENGHGRYLKGDGMVKILFLNVVDKTELLLEAAAKGYTVIMRLLVDTGIDVATQNTKGLTPLHIASRSGCDGVVEILIRHGADVTAKDRKGRTALHLAVKKRRLKVIDMLIENADNLAFRDEHGYTPLHIAAASGSVDIVQLLVQKGVDANTRDEEGTTALHLAAKKNHEVVVRWLIHHGVDQKAKDKDQLTALHWAARERHETIIRLLAEDKTNVTVKDKYGQDPLIISGREDGRESVARILVEGGADMAARDESGRSGLEYAALNGHDGVVRLLVEHKASLGNKDGFGRMALHYACMGGHAATVRLLVERKVDINATDKDGWTPLHYASRKGHKNVVEALRIAGANAAIVDRLGLTAEYYFQDGGEANFWTRALPPPYHNN